MQQNRFIFGKNFKCKIDNTLFFPNCYHCSLFCFLEKKKFHEKIREEHRIWWLLLLKKWVSKTWFDGPLEGILKEETLVIVK
jgi:hypothetical protein